MEYSTFFPIEFYLFLCFFIFFKFYFIFKLYIIVLVLKIESLCYFCYWVGERNGNPLQYSCLENPLDGGAWQTTVHGVEKSRTWLSDFTSSPVWVLHIYLILILYQTYDFKYFLPSHTVFSFWYFFCSAEAFLFEVARIMYFCLCSCCFWCRT